MRNKTKVLWIKRKISDIKINMNNKKLMTDKILSYSKSLEPGIEKYTYAERNFWALIVLSALLKNFIMIALPCCIIAMIFSIRMFQLIKYKNIKTIINKLAKDLSFKGIYDQEKVDIMLEEFKSRYGKDIKEYNELVKAIDNYKAFVLKIESLLKNTRLNTKLIQKDQESSNTVNITNRENLKVSEKSNKKTKSRIDEWEEDKNKDISILYRKEDGEFKRVDRAIEVFEDNENYNDNKKALVLKSNDKRNDKLTIYVYKKSTNLQKNIL